MTPINCPTCGTSSSAASKFCRECGTRLFIKCPNCGHANTPESKFCSECGTGIEDVGVRKERAETGLQISPPDPGPIGSIAALAPQDYAAKLESARRSRAMRGERRVVTMLFCDVTGSTAAAEQLDPEEWGEIMNGAFEHMILPVSRYEGTVARLMGDAILAFFGAPLTHEDDPQRAVLAGLEIVQNMQPYRKQTDAVWGVDIDVRVGINTGLVVVGEVGSDLRMEYTAQGDAINLAARMEQTADPGTVQVSDRTYNLVAQLFEFEDLGFLEVKGKSEPVRTYRPLRRKGIPGRLRGIEGLESDLVGRIHEKEILEAALKDLRSGRGGVLCLIGEAGLGKSRLIQELKQLQLNQQPTLSWHVTHSFSFEAEQPYGLFRRLMRRTMRAAAEEKGEKLRRKIESAVEAVPDGDRGHVQRVFESLFGLAGADGTTQLEGEAFQEALYTAMAAWWRHQARVNPVVLVCDDVHWSDPASIALLRHLFLLTDQVPLLLVPALRPEKETPAFTAVQAAGREIPHRYNEIHLLPLSAEESGVLADNLLRISDLPAGLRSRIREKSAGNPYFVEEIVRTLIDRGAVVKDQDGFHWSTTNGGSEFELPGNLQTLLIARIDRLGQEARRTLQAASVIGRSFTYRVLEILVEMAGDLESDLEQLRQAEMILETAGLPEPEYSFKHALVQDAAYSTLLLKQRRSYHRQTGEALEEIFSEQLEEQAPALGRHFSEAGDLEKSFKYFSLAGDAAFRLYANVEAVDHYGRALAAAVKLETASDQQIRHLFTRRGRALELNSRFKAALRNYEEMGDLAGRRGDQEMKLASMMARIALFAMPSSEHDPGRGQKIEDQVLRLAKKLGDPAAEARLFWNLMNLYRFTEHVQKATQYGERSYALASEVGLTEQMAFSINDLILCYYLQGHLNQAIEAAREAQALWRELENLPMLIDSLSSASYVHVPAGEFDQALQFSEEALRLSRRIDNPWGLSFSRLFTGRIWWERGQPGRAIEVMKECMLLGEQASYLTPSILTQADLSLVYADSGEFETALQLANQALRSGRANLPGFACYPLGILIRVLVKSGDLQAAQAVSRKTQLSPQQGFRIQNLPLEMARIETKLGQGKAERAREMSRHLVKDVKEHGVRETLGEALYLQARAYIATGQEKETVKALSEAREAVEKLGGQRLLWQILALQSDFESDPAESASLKAQAAKIVNQIADHAGSEGLRSSFLNRVEVRELVDFRS